MIGQADDRFPEIERLVVFFDDAPEAPPSWSSRHSSALISVVLASWTTRSSALLSEICVAISPMRPAWLSSCMSFSGRSPRDAAIAATRPLTSCWETSTLKWVARQAGPTSKGLCDPFRLP